MVVCPKCRSDRTVPILYGYPSHEAFEAEEKIDILNVFRKSEALFGIAQEVLMLKNPPQCVWVQLGLHCASAKEALENAGIAYVENLCIKLEYERLF